MVGYGKELNNPGYLGQCMVGRVSYLGRVKQGNYHTHVLYTIPNPNYNLPKSKPTISTTLLWVPRLGECYPVQVSTLPTLDTYLSLSFHNNTLPEYLPYLSLSTVGKYPLSTLSIYPIHVTSAYIRGVIEKFVFFFFSIGSLFTGGFTTFSVITNNNLSLIERKH